MPRKDQQAYNAYMKDYMSRKRAGINKAGLTRTDSGINIDTRPPKMGFEPRLVVRPQLDADGNIFPD